MKIKGRPLRREVLVTLNREEQKNKAGLILNVSSIKEGMSSEGFLLDRQEVLAVGNYCDEVKVGDKIIVDFDRYKKSKPVSQMSQEKEIVYNIPTIELNGETYGRIQETDIIWIEE